MESIFLRINTENGLPKETGNYITTLEFPDGKYIVKKAYFANNEFKLKNGRKNCKVINWFLRVEVSDEQFENLLTQNN